MALIESLNIPLGTKFSDFTIKDPFGKSYTGSGQFGNKGLLMAFTCNHCPYALAVWPRLIRLARYAEGLNIRVLAINPNIHPDYPEDAPDKMLEKIKEWRIDFPYLIDDTQKVAKAYKAQCTPDIYLFNSKKELVYHGRIDDNWKDETQVKREELKEVITQLANGLPINATQKPSMGCSIKWK
jgi:peroxiredoxin